MAAPKKKDKVWGRLIELSETMTQAEAAREVGAHPMTVSKWFREEGMEWPSKRGTPVREANEAVKIFKSCDQCGAEMKLNPSQSFRRFCSRDCTNQWQRENRTQPKYCPCGRQITLKDGAKTMYTYRKYCSDECRNKYGSKRQPDPSKQITFNCGTCGKQITRWKGYGSTTSGKRFCDNKCAIKHTKTVRNYVIRESDMVLDSTWEMLFAGLCGYFKIECLRADRSLVATNAEGRHYAPDFLVDGHLWVEVKGYDANGQASARQGWINQNGPLTVVDRELLDLLRLAVDGSQFVALLMSQVHTTEEDR